MRALGGEQVNRGVRVLGAGELNAGKGRRAIPPGFVADKTGAAVVSLEQIRPCSQRRGVLLGAGFDDGNVQQRGKCAVRLNEGNHDRAAACAHGGNIGEAGGVALRYLRAAIGRRHVGGREGISVGEGDALPQIKGVGQPILAAVNAAAKHRLGFKMLVQREQPLIEQRTDHLLRPVGTGDGVHGLAAEKGQRKDGSSGDDLRGRNGFLRRIVPEILSFGGDVRLPAARKEETQRRRAERQAKTPHGRSSRAMTAICPPRRGPRRRCDQ